MRNNKFGILSYDTSYNLGDEIQSIAAKQYLPNIDVWFDRDLHHTTFVSGNNNTGKFKVIFNGWFDGNYTHFPPPSYIDPLFISFHINESNHDNDPQYAILNKEKIDFKSLASHVSYLKQYEPIGCRDLHTKNLLEKYGIDAYFSGCLTLTLKNKFNTRNDEILVVDSHILCKNIFENLIPGEIRNKAIYLKQSIERKINHSNKMNMAQKFIDRLSQAKLVITSRLHTLLPCLALKTPVIFIHNDPNDIRFTGLNQFFKIYTKGDILDVDLNNYTNPINEELDRFIRSMKDTVKKWININSSEYVNTVNKNIKKGNSIITACMNREHHLEKSLPTWLAANPDEIIIVDWNSKGSIKKLIEKYPTDKIKLISINNVNQWVLTKSFNLAAQYTSYDTLLKLDCDSIIDEDFFLYHQISGNYYFAGDWKKSKDDNERHTNGIIYVKRKDFFLVGGYNELITTYGYDDCDLYKRLERISKRLLINLATVKHLEHSNKDRIINQYVEINNRLDIEIEKNRLISEMNLWNGYFSKFKIDYIDENQYVGQLISGCHIGRNIEKTLFDKAKKNRNFNEISPKKLFIHTRNGLGNRLRALASAYVIAKETGRKLHVVWIPDHHCQAKFSDLFSINDLFIEVIIIETWTDYNKYLEIDIFIYENEDNSSKAIYNYEKNKNKYIDDTIDEDIYIVSACTLNNKHTNWSKECQIIKQFEPISEIKDIITKFSLNNQVEETIGIHIRMGQSEQKYSYENISFYSAKDKESIRKWRSGSHWSIFTREMENILSKNPNQKFFLCCDSEESYQEIKNSPYQNNIVYFEKVHFDRSTEQIKSALIDLVLLSKTKYIMGSNWSSFTEVAHRLSGRGLKLASIDF